MNPLDPMAFNWASMPGRMRLIKKKMRALPNAPIEISYKLLAKIAIAKISPQYRRYRITLQLAQILVERLQIKGHIGVKWAFKLDLDSLSVPDLIYVSFQRLGMSWDTSTACPVIPELVVEIVYAGRTLEQLTNKAQTYLAAGVCQVWIVDLQMHSLKILYPNQVTEIFDGNMTINNELFPDQGFIIKRIFS
jgi:Uma2 family endonuclease